MSDLSFLNQIPDPLRGVADVPPVVAAPRRPAVSPTRSQTQGRRVAAFGISLAWLAAHLAVYGVRGDFERLSSAYVAAQVGVPIVFAAASLFVALAPGKFGLGVGVSIAAGAAVLGPLSFWLVAAGLQPPYPAPSSSAFWLGSLVCLDITLAWAAAPLLLAALALRHAFAAAAGWRSALVGGGLGLLSGAAINLHCSNVDPGHLLAGHGVPVVAAALVGALVVSRWARA